MIYYAVWDLKSGNILGEYRRLKAALRLVAVCLSMDEFSVEHLRLDWGDDESDAGEFIAQGEPLADLAELGY